MQVCEYQFISVELAAEKLKRIALKCLMCLMSKIISSLSRESVE